MSTDAVRQEYGEGVEYWEPGEVEVSCKGGPKMVPSLTHPRAPGLAVTMNHFGYFDVTHLASGMKMGGPFERSGNAALLLVQWAACADCTKPTGQEIAAQMDDTPVPFPRNTTTRLGETRPMSKREWMQSARSWLGADEFPWEGADNPHDYTLEVLATMPPPPPHESEPTGVSET